MERSGSMTLFDMCVLDDLDRFQRQNCPSWIGGRSIQPARRAGWHT